MSGHSFVEVWEVHALRDSVSAYIVSQLLTVTSMQVSNPDLLVQSRHGLQLPC
jgi:hypothetical protein